MGPFGDRLETVHVGAVLMTIAVIPLRIPLIVPEPLGGWYVVFGSFGWLYGSRREALTAARKLQEHGHEHRIRMSRKPRP